MDTENAANYNLVFYHIEKTAGTTFNQILSRQYGAPNVFHLHGRRRKEEMSLFKSLSAKEQAAYRCFTGHMSHLLEPHMHGDIKRVTFLRNPLHQVLSSYYYQKNKTKTKGHAKVSKMTIDEFIEDRIADGRDNIQTRYLADYVKFNEGKYGRKTTKDHGQEMYKRALAKLEEIDFVLITEEYNKSLLILEKALGWTKRPYYAHLNKSDAKYDNTPQHVIDKIEKAFALDFKLYQAALNKFNDHVVNHKGNLAKDHAKFEKNMKIAGKYHHLMHKLRRHPRINKILSITRRTTGRSINIVKLGAKKIIRAIAI